MANACAPSETPLLAIVDDDASMGISTQRLIHSFGLRAKVFTSAQEFLESCCGQDAACLILDLRLPTMTGLQLQRLLASRFHQIPIILVSAYGSDQDERAAMDGGAVDFLRKPFNEQALDSAVQKALLRAAHAQ